MTLQRFNMIILSCFFRTVSFGFFVSFTKRIECNKIWFTNLAKNHMLDECLIKPLKQYHFTNCNPRMMVDFRNFKTYVPG